MYKTAAETKASGLTDTHSAEQPYAEANGHYNADANANSNSNADSNDDADSNAYKSRLHNGSG